MSIQDELRYSELYGEYGKMFTDTQREIFDMYFSLDLSLGEIAEIKNISRQSVSDCISKVKRQLDLYEENLGFWAKKKEVLEVIENSETPRFTKERIQEILGDN